MVTLKINNSKYELIASEDINFGVLVFSCTWAKQQTENPFYLPKKIIKIGDKNSISSDELFTSVALSGFGEYVKLNPKNHNLTVSIDYDNKLINFIANKNIKKNDLLTYMFHLESISNVTVQ